MQSPEFDMKTQRTRREDQTRQENTPGSEANVKTGLLLETGFVLFLGLKIQGLFKDFPEQNSNISSTPSCKKCH